MTRRRLAPTTQAAVRAQRNRRDAEAALREGRELSTSNRTVLGLNLVHSGLARVLVNRGHAVWANDRRTVIKRATRSRGDSPTTTQQENL
jgi:predicted DCC family thiol-disulfide oxidoreductase YuxK